MLVLSRKQDERILIGDYIELKVLAIKGNGVKLGITCPKHVRVLRSELVKLTPMEWERSPNQSLEIITQENSMSIPVTSVTAGRSGKPSLAATFSSRNTSKISSFP